MSSHCYNVYKIPQAVANKPKALMDFLNGIRKDYLQYLDSKVDADSTRLLVDYAEDYIKSHPYASSFGEVGGCGYFKRVLETQSNAMEKGMPWDCSADAVIVKHKRTTVLWLFPGCMFNIYLRKTEQFKNLKRYDYSNSCDGWPKELEKFWETLFAERGESIPSNLGLNYDFWRSGDAWDLAHKFCMCYGKMEKVHPQE